MTFYVVIFGNLHGTRIGQMDGFSYMDSIVSGMIMMSVITHPYSHVAHSSLSTKIQHNIEELRVAPVPNWMMRLLKLDTGVRN